MKHQIRHASLPFLHFRKDLQLELCVCPVSGMAFLFLKLTDILHVSQFHINIL